MEGQRLAGLVGQSDVPLEVGELIFTRAESAVVVEPGLADAHDVSELRQLTHLSPDRLIDRGSDVRMDAHGRLEPVLAGEGQALVRGRDIEAGYEDTFDTGRVGGCEDLVAVLLEGLGLDVGVRVDQAQPGRVELRQAGSPTGRSRCPRYRRPRRSGPARAHR